jgi:hypothetical protein
MLPLLLITKILGGIKIEIPLFSTIPLVFFLIHRLTRKFYNFEI